MAAAVLLAFSCGNTRLSPILALFDASITTDGPPTSLDTSAASDGSGADLTPKDASIDEAIVTDAPLPPVDGSPVSVVCPPDGLVGFASLPGAALPLGTIGGRDGQTVRAANFEDLLFLAKQDAPLVILVPGPIIVAPGSPVTVSVSSNKTIEGIGKNASLTGAGFDIDGVSNVIIRNLAVSKAPYPADAIGIAESHHIWVDHCDLFSDRDQPKTPARYDGLVDITHASDFVTVSWTKFHDHYNPSIVGHSNSELAMAEDVGHLTVTYHHNHFFNVDNNTPRVRFGTVHVFNNYFEDVTKSGIASQMGANVLVEGNVFSRVLLPITTVYEDPGQGFVLTNLDFPNPCLLSSCGMSNIQQTKPWAPPLYVYSPDKPSLVPDLVKACAGPR